MPSGVLNVGPGFTTLATLNVTAPAEGNAVVIFETELNANATSQYLLCYVLRDANILNAFVLDPGDLDAPIPYYDLKQSHHEVTTLPAGAHTFEVQCNLGGGPDVNTYGSKIVVLSVPGGL